MEVSVDDLIRIIGEQQVKIRLLEQQLVVSEEEVRPLHPLSDERIAEIRKAAE